MTLKVWLNFDKKKFWLIDKLKSAGFSVITDHVPYVDSASVIQVANTVDVVVCTGEQWSRDNLEQLTAPKLIVRYGAGTDTIDLSAATELGIPVANCPGVNAPSVAELALAHILNCLRAFSYSVSGPKEGVWPRYVVGNELDGKTVGLLGFGNIAKQLRRMLTGFRVRVLAYDSMVRPDEQKYNVVAVGNAEQLFRESDIISLHIPLNEETKQSINRKFFELMKPGAFLINTSRGALINESDLIEALQKGQLRGVGLDVTATEPPHMDSPLFTMDNVYVTTHMAAYTEEAELRMQNLVFDTIVSFFRGEVPPNILNKIVLTGEKKWKN